MWRTATLLRRQGSPIGCSTQSASEGRTPGQPALLQAPAALVVAFAAILVTPQDQGFRPSAPKLTTFCTAPIPCYLAGTTSGWFPANGATSISQRVQFPTGRLSPAVARPHQVRSDSAPALRGGQSRALP